MTTAIQIRADSEAQVPPLSPLEWKVVSLAMREANEGGCGATARRGWFGRMVGGATGLRPKLPLADPRLEALRSYVCQVRDRADASGLDQRLVELGFHPGQVSAVAMLAR